MSPPVEMPYPGGGFLKSVRKTKHALISNGLFFPILGPDFLFSFVVENEANVLGAASV
jgi:hypothetical protein